MKALILIAFAFPHLALCQIKEGQVFEFGEHFDSANCKPLYLPSVSSMVCFFSRGTFFMHYNKKGVSTPATPSLLQVGYYSIVGDSIKLTCVKAGYDLSNEQQRGLAITGANGKGKSVLLKPFSLTIQQCGGKIILRGGLSELMFGSREIGAETSYMRSIKDDKLFSKIYEELKKLEGN